MDFQKRLVLLLAITLVTIAILAAASIFMGVDIEGRAKELGLLRADLNFRTRAIESIADLRSDYEKAAPYLEEVKNILPTQDQLVNFSRDMNLIANQNQVSLSLSLKGEIRPKTETPTLQKNDFGATAEGRLANLISFLKAIKLSRYFTKVESIDLSRRAEGTFNILISGQVFSF